MKLIISNNKTIQELQQEFSAAYHFLKLEFYKMQKTDPSVIIKKYLPGSSSLQLAGLSKEGTLEIKDEMTVGELEKNFLQLFGIRAQVSRKAGTIWLETTMTNNLSLGKQNEYGREITLANKGILPDGSIGMNQ